MVSELKKTIDYRWKGKAQVLKYTENDMHIRRRGHLAEWSLPTPEDTGSNPVGHSLSTNCMKKT